MTRETILLVDDEAGIRRVLSVLLADMGYEVLTADDGRAALELFRRHLPPIVVTDIKMPGMDGLALLRAIKEEAPDTEVIMITGHGDMELAVESLKLDAADFITKPIANDALEVALQRARKKIALRRRLQAYTADLEAMVRETSARLVAAERQSAAGQVVEGLFAALQAIGRDLPEGLRSFDDIPCLVSVHNREQRIVAVNRFFRERLGDLTGQPSASIYGGPAADPDLSPVGETLRLGTYRRSVERVRIDGEEVSMAVHTLPIRNREGEVELVLEISSDIGAAQSLAEDLESVRQRHRQLFDEVPCYITVQDRALRLTEANRAFQEDFGPGLGEHCFRVYKQRDTPCEDCPVMISFADGESHQAETVVTTRDGDEVHVLTKTAPIRNPEGQITHVMEMSADITAIRRLQSHLANLGLMIGSVSHGIKGLLTGLDGGLYLLDAALKSADLDEAREGRQIVGQMARRIRTMVLDILYYAKERRLERERLEVAEFARDVARTVESRMREERIDFTVDLEEARGCFEADAEALASALVNILSNAVDACAADASGRPRRVGLRARTRDGTVTFEVEDNGVGMDPETVQSLFALFFSTKGKSGTGLGLFISRKIVSQHGGRIQVHSEKGVGSRFTVTLPAASPTAPPAG
jgi:signal transduction histidine kinase/FixJ family two-component response regulator